MVDFVAWKFCLYFFFKDGFIDLNLIIEIETHKAQTSKVLQRVRLSFKQIQ